MELKLNQISSLEKILSKESIPAASLCSAKALRGEHFSYQIALSTDEPIDNKSILKVCVDSPISHYIKLYSVKDVIADFPKREEADDDYLFDSPRYVPDLLQPLEEQGGYLNFVNGLAVLWVEVSVPRELSAGSYPITVKVDAVDIDKSSNYVGTHLLKSISLDLEVLAATLPEQEFIFTQWFHVDCIASAHKVEIYSEEHWKLIDNYMALAAALGINMILTPVVTPPLDTAPGTARPITQLVKIEKGSEGYKFDFTLLRRYVLLAKKNGIKYFEISHLFTQWGCYFTPNIMVTENGGEKLMFGWHVPANDPSYAEFLSAFVPALLEALDELSVKELSYFHVSDEPSKAHLESYEYASNLLKPLISGCKTMDALSNIDFYERGLVKHPVCSTAHIEPFVEAKVAGLWAYYCCGEFKYVSNRFMAMPSYRNRMLGLQLYKYGIEGFLHWGYNFYYSQYSLYEINPYLTSSADGIYSSGDTYSVYPGKNGPLPSVRAFVFREALEDIALCRLLEKKIGKDAVVRLIEDVAEMEITFKEYPRNSEFLLKLTDKMKDMLK